MRKVFKTLILLLALSALTGCDLSFLDEKAVGIDSAKQDIGPFEVYVKFLRKEERKVQGATFFYYMDSGWKKIPTSERNYTAFYVALRKSGEKAGRVAFGKCKMIFEDSNDIYESVRASFYFPYETTDDLSIFRRDERITFEMTESGVIDGVIAFDNLKKFNNNVGLVIPVNLMGEGKKIKDCYEFRVGMRVIQAF